LLQSLAQLIPRFFQFKVCLESHPEFFGSSKITRKAEGCVSRDSSLPMHDFIDPPGRYTHVSGNPILADAHGKQKFLEKHFSGMNVCQFRHNSILFQW